MNIPDDLSLEDRAIWKWYEGFCVGCWEQGVAIHEEPPRSVNPRYGPEHRFLLCERCHTEVQVMPRQKAGKYLVEKRRIFAAAYKEGK